MRDDHEKKVSLRGDKIPPEVVKSGDPGTMIKSEGI